MQTTAKRDCNSKIFQLLRVPDYASIIGNGSNTCQIHGRFILLDNVTGYRSPYQQKSSIISVSTL